MPKPKPANTGSEDRGRRLYVGPQRYTQRMRSRSIAEYDRRWRQKHSESKKPYTESNYSDMEYHFDPWDPTFPPHTPPGMPPIYPDNPSAPPVDGPPTVSGSPGKTPQVPPFLGCDFWSQTFSPYKIMPGEMAYSKFYLGSDETGIREVEVTGPIDVLGLASLKQMTGPKQQASFGDSWVVVKAWDQGKIANDPHYKNVVGDIYYQVQVRTNSYFAPKELAAGPGQIAKSNPWASVGVCACKGYVRQCPPEIPLSFDAVNSATSIPRGDWRAVYVLDGLPPFKWSVSGTGFQVINATTTLRNNWVYAENYACGPGDVVCEDACGDQATWSVLCDVGEWVKDENSCACKVIGAATEWSDAWRWITRAGKYRCNEYWEQTWGSACTEDFCTANNCSGRCAGFAYCDRLPVIDCGCDIPCVPDKNPKVYYTARNHLCWEYFDTNSCSCWCKGSLSYCWEWKCL